MRRPRTRHRSPTIATGRACAASRRSCRSAPTWKAWQSRCVPPSSSASAGQARPSWRSACWTRCSVRRSCRRSPRSSAGVRRPWRLRRPGTSSRSTAGTSPRPPCARSATSEHVRLELVLEQQPHGRVGRLVRQSEQHACLVADGAARGAKLAEHRRAELLFVIVERTCFAPFAESAVHLDARLEGGAEPVAVLPAILHLDVRAILEFAFEDQVEAHVAAPDLLLPEQAEFDRVLAVVLERVRVLGEQAEIGPVAALLGELEDVLPRDLGCLEVLTRLA